MPAGGEDSDHRHGRHRRRARRARIHDRRRRRRCRSAPRTSSIRSSGRSCSTASATTCSGTTSRASPIWSAPSDTRGEETRNGSAPSRARRRHRRRRRARSPTGCAASVGGFKIGSRLFTSDGPAFVEELVGRGDRVFLDLKFHDIPNTVAGAVAAATRLGVWMVNVHASGGGAMMRAARDAADEEAARRSRPAPLVIAVTDADQPRSSRRWPRSASTGSMAAQVERLAALAEAAGLDGVVASPQEIGIIRRRVRRAVRDRDAGHPGRRRSPRATRAGR